MSWRDLAACRRESVSIFFDKAREKEANAMCAACPVRVECLEDALEWSAEYDFGFRAGMPERARRRLRRTGGRFVRGE